MLVALPESVDAWRMVAARRSFAGQLPVATLRRLCEELADSAGEVRFTLDFGRDDLQVSYVDVHADAALSLTCQRTLEPFLLPLSIHTRLGMIRDEREEAGLPPDCEPLLLPADGRINPADVIEDELLLALPLVPVNPDSSLPTVAALPPEDATVEGMETNPFALLRELKK